MIDRYTKVVLTLIAASLIALVMQNSVPRAQALGADCGAPQTPCYVESVGRFGMTVNIAN